LNNQIFFLAPGLGKTTLVRKFPELFIDCDGVLEFVTGKSVNELTKQSNWDQLKSQILNWKAEYFPEHTLLTGKKQHIKDADVVYLFRSANQMLLAISNPLRDNPINDWDCVKKLDEYKLEAAKYKVKVVYR
jgi:hypothetical protein